MPDINKINGLVLCDEIHVNGVTIANILNIDSITKNCCTANGPSIDKISCGAILPFDNGIPARTKSPS